MLTGEMPRVQTSRLGKNPIEVDSDGGEDLHVDYEVGNDVDEGPEHGEIDGLFSVVLRKMVLYLDYVEFGDKNIPIGFPRISHWKNNMITLYSDLDKVDEENFGLRPIKDFNDTTYFKVVPPENRINTFRDKLESAIGTMLPAFIKEKICSMVVSHCSANHIVDSESCEDIAISIMLLLCEHAGSRDGGDPDENLIFDNINPGFQPNYAIDVENEIPCDAHNNGSTNKSVASKANETSFRHTPSHDKELGVNDDSVIVSKSVVRFSLSPNFEKDQGLLTPEVGYANNSNSRFASGPTVSAVAAVRNVANKIKSRLSQLNNDDKRGPLFPDLIDSCEDEAVGYAKSLSCQKEYLNPRYVTSSSSQPGISFHCLDNSPIQVIGINNNEGTSRTHCIQNVKKRRFDDVTNSPDVEYLGHSIFPDCCKELLLTDLSCADLSKVKRSFLGAASARKLHLSDMINNLQTFWDSYDGSSIDFTTLKKVYPCVPKQRSWVVLPNEFSSDDIDNIRMLYANQLFFHPTNKMLQTEVEEVVLNWFNPCV
ncbi:Os04g0322700 [Oryza sativa Japonica Group]|uniref:Os04g0322700 protein n=1 Tax=Oryza sativa subsp. japonica TaxID=39947 RepID=A0A0P0W8Y4_ORYSJ|nr:Os04g0322700 [Oryza sativa Japonica Group]